MSAGPRGGAEPAATPGRSQPRAQRAAAKRTAPRRFRRRPFEDDAAISLGILPDLLGFHLRCAQVAVFQDFAAAFGDHEISPPQLGALLLIDANPGVSQSAIAEALRFDRSTLVQIVDRLEELGLVVRETSTLDRRSHALQLTGAGTKAMERFRELVRTHEAAVASDITAEERRTLIALLERIYRRRPAK
jgi:DNA-binding MarR family transcriptional regulator